MCFVGVLFLARGEKSSVFLRKHGQNMAKIETYIKKEFYISFILNYL